MPYSRAFPVGNRVVLLRPIKYEGRRFAKRARGAVVDNYAGEAVDIRMDDGALIHIAPTWIDPTASELAKAFGTDWFAPMRACANAITLAIALASAGTAVALDSLFDTPPIGTEIRRTIKIGANTYRATLRRPNTSLPLDQSVWTVYLEDANGRPITFAF